MIVKGSVRHWAARKYADYCYRKPIMTRLDIYTVDPARSNGKPQYSAALKSVELADYEAVISTMNEKGERRLSITMLPNEYTAAKVPAVVYEMTIIGILPNSGFCIDEAMHRCFSET